MNPTDERLHVFFIVPRNDVKEETLNAWYRSTLRRLRPEMDVIGEFLNHRSEVTTSDCGTACLAVAAHIVLNVLVAFGQGDRQALIDEFTGTARRVAAAVYDIAE